MKNLKNKIETNKDIALKVLTLAAANNEKNIAVLPTGEVSIISTKRHAAFTYSAEQMLWLMETVGARQFAHDHAENYNGGRNGFKRSAACIIDTADGPVHAYVDHLLKSFN